MKQENTTRRTIINASIWIAMAICGVIIFKETQTARIREKINKQVEEYKKTLPGYLEQEQKIEHYRDSLINVNER